jgi:nucleotide-binding universal stress UspA family protein
MTYAFARFDAGTCRILGPGGPVKFPPTKVLVPTDFSDLSLEALDAAVRIAGGAERVHVVSILVPIVPPSPGIVWGTIDDQVRQVRTREALDQILAERGLQHAKVTVLIGSPAMEVVQFAEEIAADLIVVSSHGRTGLVRAALGSVAERIVRLANCPVLVIKKA